MTRGLGKGNKGKCEMDSLPKAAESFVVEIKIEDTWGMSPKIFDDKEKAEDFVRALKQKYPMISECRVVTRQIEEPGKK
jgi:hypothetical protein